MTASALTLLFLSGWLGIQRGEILLYRGKCAIAAMQRDNAIRERTAAMQSCNDRLAKTEAARLAAEKQARFAIEAKNADEAQRDQAVRELNAIRGR